MNDSLEDEPLRRAERATKVHAGTDEGQAEGATLKDDPEYEDKMALYKWMNEHKGPWDKEPNEI